MTEAPSPMAVIQKDQISLRDEYSKLVLEKEFLISHRSLQLKSEYMLKVGAKEYAVYKKNIELRRAKRKLGLVRSYTNRNETPDIRKIDETIDNEFIEYSEKIKEQAEQIDALLKISKTEKLSKEDSTELRTMYNQIVKTLHPDLNPYVTEKDLEKYQMAVEAYHRGDLQCIRAIYWTLDDNKDIPYISDIECKITELKDSIEQIKKVFPFDKTDFLSDPEAIEKRNKELDSMMESYSEELKNINNAIEELEAKI